MNNFFMVVFLASCVSAWFFIRKRPSKKKRNSSLLMVVASFLMVGIFTDSSQAKGEKENDPTPAITSSTSASLKAEKKKTELILNLSREFEADKVKQVRLTGTTTPSAKVSIASSNQNVIADKDGKFTLVYAIDTEEPKELTIISELDNEKKEAKILAKQNQEIISIITAEKKATQEKAEKEKQQKERAIEESKKTHSDLASLSFSGTQTIDVYGGVPNFTQEDLTVNNGAWEKYSDLDSLNRAGVANALLNKSLMPIAKRTDISSVKPTGWHNKKLEGGYLYNRSHLIGFALSGQNANWKNLITGTRQLNSPEMLRFELDIKYYLEQDSDHYVRYRVTPVFRGNELLARGVQLEAQSVGNDSIKFNVFIFNVQDGVELNYADGTSTINELEQEEIVEPEKQNESEVVDSQPVQEPNNNQAASEEKQYVDENGNGLIKGSKKGIYHIPGSTYYNRTTNPVAMFKTVSEAENAGYVPPKR